MLVYPYALGHGFNSSLSFGVKLISEDVRIFLVMTGNVWDVCGSPKMFAGARGRVWMAGDLEVCLRISRHI